ncbi:MAG: NADH-quinone oxidoreductase subunit J [Planctomycetes bacterium]|nr:NADH-quinone oxidoreductase subunit J [Planctomycetota bacterium]
MEPYLFYVMAATSVVASLYLIFEKNPVFCALYMVFSFINIAVLYVLLEAQFIAAVQVIVYTGAIMVLFLFVIMLLMVNVEQKQKDDLPFQRIPAMILGFVLLVVMGLTIKSKIFQGKEGEYTSAKVESIGHTQLIGKLLFTDYLLPFEMTSILLFVAVIGAIILAKRKV